jgi:hypothetical protein
MIMKTKTIIGILSALALLTSGCVTGNPVFGSYANDGSTLVLQEDYTYIYTPAASHLKQKGVFSQNGDEIQLTSMFGTTTILKYTASGLVDDENKLWRRT